MIPHKHIRALHKSYIKVSKSKLLGIMSMYNQCRSIFSMSLYPDIDTWLSNIDEITTMSNDLINIRHFGNPHFLQVPMHRYRAVCICFHLYSIMFPEHNIHYFLVCLLWIYRLHIDASYRFRVIRALFNMHTNATLKR